MHDVVWVEVVTIVIVVQQDGREMVRLHSVRQSFTEVTWIQNGMTRGGALIGDSMEMQSQTIAQIYLLMNDINLSQKRA